MAIVLVDEYASSIDSVDRDVLVARPIRAISDISSPALIPVDGLTGKYQVDRRRNYPIIDIGFELILDNRADITIFRTFFADKRGRLNPFWMPSWSYDFVMTQDFDNVNKYLYIRDIGFLDNYTDDGGATIHNARKHIAFCNPDDDEYFFNEIHAVAAGGADEERLTMVYALPGGKLDKEYWEIVCFLNFVRFAQDGVDLAWIDDDLVNIKMRTRLIKPVKLAI